MRGVLFAESQDSDAIIVAFGIWDGKWIRVVSNSELGGWKQSVATIMDGCDNEELNNFADWLLENDYHETDPTTMETVGLFEALDEEQNLS